MSLSELVTANTVASITGSSTTKATALQFYTSEQVRIGKEVISLDANEIGDKAKFVPDEGEIEKLPENNDGYTYVLDPVNNTLVVSTLSAEQILRKIVSDTTKTVPSTEGTKRGSTRYVEPNL